MKDQHVFRNLRIVVGFALIGSVLSGATLGHFDFSIDPRIVGAAIFALGSAARVFYFS